MHVLSSSVNATHIQQAVLFVFTGSRLGALEHSCNVKDFRMAEPNSK